MFEGMKKGREFGKRGIIRQDKRGEGR